MYCSGLQLNLQYFQDMPAFLMTPETERKHNPYTQCQSPVGIPQVDEDALLSEPDGNQDWGHSEGNQAEGKLDAIMGDPVLLTPSHPSHQFLNAVEMGGYHCYFQQAVYPPTMLRANPQSQPNTM